MSIFKEDIISNSDCVVLSLYTYVHDTVTHMDYLREKDNGMYPLKTFARGQYLWEAYVTEAMDDVLKIVGDVEEFINKEDFLHYIKNSPLTSKLEFRGETWYEIRYLWDVFEAYNEHVMEMYLKWRYVHK